MAKLYLLFGLSALHFREAKAAFDCNVFGSPEAVTDGGLSLVKDFVEQNREAGTIEFENECMNQALKRNYFEAAEVMVNEYFSKDSRRASLAESTARNTISEVRNQQDYFLGTFETISYESISKNIPVISPAFRWAQDLNLVYLEVKYSTRFDSPACLDIFDQEFRIDDDQHLYLSAMCRNDKKLLKYELKLHLYNMVSDEPEESYLEDQSVGRVLITLAKFEQPSRWARLLLDNSRKPPNMGIQWELWEKYEKELEEFQPDDDTDGTEEVSSNAAGDDASAGGEEPKKKKKVKKGGKKKPAGKAKKEQPQEPEKPKKEKVESVQFEL